MAKCNKCGAELIDLFTSQNVCPNDCSTGGKTEECGCGAIFIDGVHCFRDAIGAVLSIGQKDDVDIHASDIQKVHDALQLIVGPKGYNGYSFETPKNISFEYFKEGNSLRISYGKLTDANRDVFHVFFGDDVHKLIKFLSP